MIISLHNTHNVSIVIINRDNTVSETHKEIHHENISNSDTDDLGIQKLNTSDAACAMGFCAGNFRVGHVARQGYNFMG